MNQTSDKGRKRVCTFWLIDKLCLWRHAKYNSFLTMIPNLFSPIKLGACALKNRIFMPPLTRSRAGKGNAPQALNSLYYAQRAGPYPAEGFQPLGTPRALETSEIPGRVADFRQAAINAMQACFDGVEVHGANGYLIDQFLRDKTNKRTDRYGGSIENRSRFLLEVVDAVIDAVGADRTGLRISPQNTFNDIDDSNPHALFNYVLTSLSDKGLAYLHVVEGDLTGKPVSPFDYARIKNLFGGLYIANNGYDKSRADAAIAQQKADAIAFGKLFIANPDLVTRFLFDAPLSQIDQATLYGGAEKGYTDYPLLSAVRDSVTPFTSQCVPA